MSVVVWVRSSLKNKIMFVNKKARFEYEFIRTEVAGIQLHGSEVKSIKDGKISMTEAFCVFIGGELYVKNINITGNGTAYSHEPIRDRKLLLKKQELIKLQKDLIKGFTIIPYKFFKNERGVFKMEIALARGKKLHDKRATIKERDINREINKILA
jgi:SsrA-binding protein